MNQANRKPVLIGSLIVLVVVVAGAILFLGRDEDKDGGDKNKSYTVGILDNFGAASEGFKQGMAELGYIEGENITYVVAPADAENPVQMIVDQKPDLIFCAGTTVCLQVKEATVENKIPAVFVLVSDPVGSGLVADFTKPGGNLTGVSSVAVNSENEGRRLDWLVQIDPSIKRVLLIYAPTDPTVAPKLNAVQMAADNLDVELVLHEVDSPEAVTEITNNFPDDVDAIFTFSQQVFSTELLTILAQQAIEKQVPYSAPGIQTGALMSYASDVMAMGKQSSALGDKILDGSSPANLPVETPEFFLAIHLVTAEAIGLEIPDTLLRQADIIQRPVEDTEATPQS